ncbi:Uncharacterised protein [Streptococcus pneumoniae]|nr:Uncharacterised protein [Streptococcus pneumoniae]
MGGERAGQVGHGDRHRVDHVRGGGAGPLTFGDDGTDVRVQVGRLTSEGSGIEDVDRAGLHGSGAVGAASVGVEQAPVARGACPLSGVEAGVEELRAVRCPEGVGDGPGGVLSGEHGGALGPVVGAVVQRRAGFEAEQAGSARPVEQVAPVSGPLGQACPGRAALSGCRPMP